MVARAPVPRSPMTSPSKTWTRSRSVSLGLPLISSFTAVSLTRTCTRTVSPGERRGRPFFRSLASMLSIGFMSLFLSVNDFILEDAGAGSPRVLVLDLAQERLVLRGEGGPLQQVGTPLARGPERLLAAPPADLPVVPGEEHLGHREPAHGRGTRVVRPVQYPVRERVLLRGALVPEGAGEEAHGRLGHREGGHLPAREHEVAQAHLLGGHRLPHPLVDPLVAAAEEHEAAEAGVTAGGVLVEAAAPRGEQHDRVAVAPAVGPGRFRGAEEGLRLHHHARTAPEGGVVHGAVPVVREVAQVVHVDIPEPRPRGAVDDALREETADEPGEDREDVDPHSTSSGTAATMTPPARSTRFTKVSARGMSISPPSPRTTSTGASPPVSQM